MACSCDRAVRAEAALAVSTASADALRASLDAALGKAAALKRQLKAAERAAAVATGGALPVSTEADDEGRVVDAVVLAPVPSTQAHGGGVAAAAGQTARSCRSPPGMRLLTLRRSPRARRWRWDRE